MARKKFKEGDLRYWTQVLIASSQVTFGVAWAALFVPPFDTVKAAVVLFNLLASVILWYTGWRFLK